MKSSKYKTYLLSSLLLSLLVVAILLLSSCSTTDEKKSTTKSSSLENATETIEEMTITHSENAFVVVGENQPVSRGMVAKMLAFLVYDKNEINLLTRDIAFEDTQRDFWYDRYINALIHSGLWSFKMDSFRPEEGLTYEEATVLIAPFQVDISLEFDENKENKTISYAKWVQLYEKVLAALEISDIKKENFVVFATTKQDTSLDLWEIATSTGIKTYPGLYMEDYIDKEISVLTKGDEVVAVVGVESIEPLVEQAYVLEMAEKLKVFIGGTIREYPLSTPLHHEVNPFMLCDFVIGVDGSIDTSNLVFYTANIEDTIKEVDDEAIELLEHGYLPLAKSVKVYNVVSDTVFLDSIQNLHVGSNRAIFLKKDGEIASVIIYKEITPDTIRVVLNTTNFESLYHDEVIISADQPFTILMDEKITSYEANEVVDVSSLLTEENKRAYISTNELGKTEIQSIIRKWPKDAEGKDSHPQYRGVLEVIKKPEGYVLVNELDMEAYLYAVVPSEMPTSHGLEAAKIQAITARSYAVNQVRSNRYRHVGAHADDSVLSQVYNNIPETPLSIKAVDSTKGACVTKDGAVVSTNFFSTSAGVTANSGDTWAHYETKQFPSPSSSHLVSVPVHLEEMVDLSSETAARTFLLRQDVDAFEYSFPWFRWKVTIGADVLTHWINEILSKRYEADPYLILTKNEKGVFESQPIDSIGVLQDISVIKRGVAGNIMSLELVGSEKTVCVHTEYNIRQLLKPVAIEGAPIAIERQDGTRVENYAILPSSFFVFDKALGEENNLMQVTFYGGGNGHGVGMSQNGVKGMLNAGYSVEDILTHFYRGTSVTKVYE